MIRQTLFLLLALFCGCGDEPTAPRDYAAATQREQPSIGSADELVEVPAPTFRWSTVREVLVGLAVTGLFVALIWRARKTAVS